MITGEHCEKHRIYLGFEGIFQGTGTEALHQRPSSVFWALPKYPISIAFVPHLVPESLVPQAPVLFWKLCQLLRPSKGFGSDTWWDTKSLWILHFPSYFRVTHLQGYRIGTERVLLWILLYSQIYWLLFSFESIELKWCIEQWKTFIHSLVLIVLNKN